MRKLIACVFLLLILPCNSFSYAKENDVVIKFGFMKETSSGSYVTKATTTIPLKLKDTGFRFGFTVEHKKGISFKAHYVIYLPSPPKQLTGGLKKADIKNEGRIISEPPQTYKGLWADPFSFDEGDPLGDWKIQIYVNDDLIKTIHFRVVP